LCKARFARLFRAAAGAEKTSAALRGTRLTFRRRGKVESMAVFKPTGTLHRVTDITPELLGAMHIRALVLDVDNTMAPHGDQTPYTGVLEWTKRMTAAGVRLVVVSNNYKKRVAPFAAQFSLPYVSFACKPSPFGYLRAKRLSGARVRECLVVGDQIFTDILGANLCGMPSVLLDPIARDPAATVRFKRWLEHFLRPHYKRLDYKRLDSKIRSPEI